MLLKEEGEYLKNRHHPLILMSQGPKQESEVWASHLAAGLPVFFRSMEPLRVRAPRLFLLFS